MAGETAFRPEVFFVGRTEGSGVVRDPFGRVVRRCEISTEGKADPGRNTIHFTEIFTYDDGEVDVWRWVMTHARDGRYVAAEANAGSGITGQRVGDDYSLSFSRPVGAAKGVAAPRFATRFTLLAQDVALKSVRVSLFGLPIGQMTAIHRKVN
ncbi:MAG TPA: DUF3833 family protein [Caulobacteraceae bacterium]|jgi:hypothetical protein|nr:DUF3833 family protein [Caulobacteraceae bacterium]